jgi:predicted amidohydrolase YtcJ
MGDDNVGATQGPGDGEKIGRRGITRRDLLKTGGVLGLAGVIGTPMTLAAARPAAAQPGTPLIPSRAPVAFVNGKIHTMDAGNSVVSSVVVADGLIQHVGDRPARMPRGTHVVDLHGRMVVPGIIDNHNHIVLMGNRPGHHTPLENAYSIADIQETYAARAAGVPAGEFITTIGGFHFNQFAEVRLPTLDELDAAVPDHGAYISQSFAGPSTTNSVGKAFFEAQGIEVGDDGSIAAGFGFSPTGEATFALRSTFLNDETRYRGVIDAMRYAVSLGVTTHLDQGAFQAFDSPADGAASEDNYTMHLPFLAVYADNQASIRLRINFLHRDPDTELVTLDERLRNQFPFFGNDLVKTGGIGEFIALGLDEEFSAAALKIAEARWRAEVHSLNTTDFMTEIEAFEAAHAQHPIDDLRWVIAHVPFITEDWVDRLKAIGGGLSLTSWRYLAGSATSNGPPFRMIVDNGINVGMSSDGMQIAPMNPWVNMYYAVTGKNALGDVINGDQTISRQEVLELYTSRNGWFIGEEDKMGSLEPGKFGDLVVLSDDYFAVPDEGLRHITSDLTMVDGTIVHDVR